MVIIDAHCDTLTRAVNNNKSIIDNPFHWDIKRALQYDGFVQVMAVFQNPDTVKPTMLNTLRYIREAEKVQNQTPSFKVCKNFKDMEEGLKDKKVCGILSIEGGEALEGNTENLDILFNAGIRIITLTWNYANELGDGAELQQNGGLTSFGHEIVRLMQQKGMIIDLSHTDERTFEDCIIECYSPVIASHSNSRVLCNHPRNLWDWQIEQIAKTNGVIGINFYSKFICESAKTDISSMIRHIEYICELAGEDAVGIGADFDGMNSLPEQIVGVQSLDLLFNELARLNYSDKTIQKIAGNNFLRVFRDVLPEETGIIYPK